MSRSASWIALVFAAAAQAAPAAPASRLSTDLIPQPQQAQVAHLAADLIQRFHYRALPLDDAMSERVFDRYLKALDAEKLVFSQPDVDQLAGIRTRLDDAILDQDLGAFFLVFNFYARRAAERIAFARRLLGEGFDFSHQESYQLARDKADWPQSEAEMQDHWRKRVKHDWLRLKLAGKDHRSIVEILDRRYDKLLREIKRLRSDDVFQTLMNAYTMSIEPHTTFKGPRAAAESDMAMKLSMVGVGLMLAQKDGYALIREVVPGSPSALSGRLGIGDRIVGVAQGKRGAVTDIQGWRMDDIVGLIRGAAGTAVVLDVLPAGAGKDGKRLSIRLVRQRLAMQEQRARKSILAVADGDATRRIGVVTLPSFYIDFEARLKGDRNFRSATHDVTRLLGELEAARVDGVLIDLRNNGGGSLGEAIAMTGLFVGPGPVVQQRDARGVITVEHTRRAGPAWRGPLAVLINRDSASASEIFAAAIQDYGRGLVIGESSFGKGTVQTMVSLHPGARHQPRLGELRLTVAQFFRVDGRSTQLRGVLPDIRLPAPFELESAGESGYANPLPSSRIRAADYAPAGDLQSVLPMLLTRHQARLKIDRDFSDLQEDSAEFKLQRGRNLVSLNEGQRRLERHALETKMLARKARRTGDQGSGADAPGGTPAVLPLDDGLQSDERNLAAELAAEIAGKATRDIWLGEAVRILSDKAGLAMPVVDPGLRVEPVVAER